LAGDIEEHPNPEPTMPALRRLLLFMVAATAAGLAVAWLLWPRTAITTENAAKVCEGMTLAEVEAILGGPARDESTGPLTAAAAEVEDADAEVRVELIQVSYDWTLRLTVHAAKCWTSDHLVVRVEFDEQGRVAGKDSLEVRRVYESPLDKLRRWLGL
jgi:hypothetical protein